MGYVDVTSHDYQAFVQKADYYATTSVNGLPNGQWRMTTAESKLMAHDTQVVAAVARINELENKVKTITEILDKMTEALKGSVTNIEMIMDHLDVQPVLQLVDDEFFAAAANPEKYEREYHADQRSSVQANSWAEL